MQKERAFIMAETTQFRQRLHMVYASDVHYLFLTKVSICSAFALASNPEALTIHIFDCGIPDDAWETWVNEMKALTHSERYVRHIVGLSRFAGLPGWKGSAAVYARLYPADILTDIPWCAYVDGDTLFVDDPLKLCDLFDPTSAIQGYEVGGVKDSAIGAREKKRHITWHLEHGLEADYSTFVCSGFLLMNLEWLREHRFVERSIELLTRFPDNPFADELPLNYLYAGAIRALPQGWGVMGGPAAGTPEVGCIHYTTVNPTKSRFNTQWGFDDTTAIWMTFVRVRFRLSVQAVCGVPMWKWRLGRLYNRLLGIALRLRLPLGKRRVEILRGRFATGPNRKLLSVAFWHRA